nr:hypothetical protein BaRGS_031786 [Batillaria attramentaria]
MSRSAINRESTISRQPTNRALNTSSQRNLRKGGGCPSNIALDVKDSDVVSKGTGPGDSGKDQDQDSDAEYDDDLDYVEPKPPLPGPLDPERVRSMYREACERNNVITSNKFLRGVARSRVVVGHSGLAAADIKCIAISLVTDIIVHELYLQGNRMGSEGMRCLADMFQSNRNVKVLDVSDNMLGTAGAIILAEVIEENDAMLSLRAAGNKFATKAAMYIGAALKKNNTLRTLDLSRNEFMEEGGIHIADGLAENSTLQGVDLSYNHLRWKGMKAMAHAIAENISIRNLDLSWNGVGLDGSKQIGEALNYNDRLLTLNLRGCRLDAQCLITLVKAMKMNETLKTMDVSIILNRHKRGAVNYEAAPDVCPQITYNPLTNSDAILLMKTLIEIPTLAIEHVQMASVMVSKDFLGFVNTLKTIKPTFTVAYMGLMGIVDKSMNRMDAMDLTGGDPLEVLIRYTRSKNLRLVDLFSRLDTDKSCTITRAELVHGVQDAGIPLSIQQMDRLIAKVDADGDGEIDFRELLEAYKAYIRKLHKRGQKIESQYVSSVRAYVCAFVRVCGAGIIGAVVFFANELHEDAMRSWGGVLVIMAAVMQAHAAVCIVLPVVRGQAVFEDSQPRVAPIGGSQGQILGYPNQQACPPGIKVPKHGFYYYFFNYYYYYFFNYYYYYYYCYFNYYYYYFYYISRKMFATLAYAACFAASELLIHKILGATGIIGAAVFMSDVQYKDAIRSWGGVLVIIVAIIQAHAAVCIVLPIVRGQVVFEDSQPQAAPIGGSQGVPGKGQDESVPTASDQCGSLEETLVVVQDP